MRARPSQTNRRDSLLPDHASVPADDKDHAETAKAEHHRVIALGDDLRAVKERRGRQRNEADSERRLSMGRLGHQWGPHQDEGHTGRAGEEGHELGGELEQRDRRGHRYLAGGGWA